MIPQGVGGGVCLLILLLSCPGVIPLAQIGTRGAGQTREREQEGLMLSSEVSRDTLTRIGNLLVSSNVSV